VCGILGCYAGACPVHSCLAQSTCPTELPNIGRSCSVEGAYCGYTTDANACGADNCYCQAGTWNCEPTCIIVDAGDRDDDADGAGASLCTVSCNGEQAWLVGSCPPVGPCAVSPNPPPVDAGDSASPETTCQATAICSCPEIPAGPGRCFAEGAPPCCCPAVSLCPGWCQPPFGGPVLCDGGSEEASPIDAGADESDAACPDGQYLCPACPGPGTICQDHECAGPNCPPIGP